MSDGIQWLVDLGDQVSGVVFARGISASELALRLGGDPDGATDPITNAQVGLLWMEEYRPGEDADGIVRVGECAGWSFALEYGESVAAESDRLAAVSRGGIEAVHYVPMRAHPPATISYACDGIYLCGFGLKEEDARWGQQPDLLLTDLVTGHVLAADGITRLAPEDEPFKITYARTLGILERRFGLSLSPEYLKQARLPAYAVSGTPDMDL